MYIQKADEDAAEKAATGQSLKRTDGRGTSLVSTLSVEERRAALRLQTPEAGLGDAGLLHAVSDILSNSVNTWNRGFLDKLYASADPAGLASELVLAALNTNCHVYAVSPALTLVEKHTARALAAKFGLDGPCAGGITVPGGTAANTVSLLAARNLRFPRVKTEGLVALARKPVLFASSEAHYSIATAAAQLGLGSAAVESVPVDEHGRMDVSVLADLVAELRKAGNKEPFYVCATAGTTVRGAYDDIAAIATVCRRYGMWLHVDASWGGPAIFSPTLAGRLSGSSQADSIVVNPHKMLGVPVTCSFLLARDMRTFFVANSSDAGYLFHSGSGAATSTSSDLDAEAACEGISASSSFLKDVLSRAPDPDSVFDLASFSPQCGRKGDALKMYLAWTFHGNEGFASQVESAFSAAQRLTQLLAVRMEILLVSDNPPPCCQVCFYYVGEQGLDWLVENLSRVSQDRSDQDRPVLSRVTRALAHGLTVDGWMVDYAPGSKGEFLRVVMNRGISDPVVDALVSAIIKTGKEVLSSGV